MPYGLAAGIKRHDVGDVDGHEKFHDLSFLSCPADFEVPLRGVCTLNHQTIKARKNLQDFARLSFVFAGNYFYLIAGFDFNLGHKYYSTSGAKEIILL